MLVADPDRVFYRLKVDKISVFHRKVVLFFLNSLKVFKIIIKYNFIMKGYLFSYSFML
jgi:hypothetical protein